MSKARIIADYAGTGASTDLATQTELDATETAMGFQSVPHIIPGVLYPAVVGKLLDGSTSHSGNYGTAQADGFSYYYTDIKGSKPIKDPRIGSYFGSQRHTFRSIQLLEQETAMNGYDVWSIDGREWMKIWTPTANKYITCFNTERGVGLRSTDASSEWNIEVVGYFNDANLSVMTMGSNNLDSADMYVDGVAKSTNQNIASTSAGTPISNRYVDSGSICALDLGDTTLGLHTLRIHADNTAGNSGDLFAIELIAQDTSSDANKVKIQIPSQNVVSYGKKFTVSGTPHYNPFATKGDGSASTIPNNTTGDSVATGWAGSTSAYWDSSLDTATSLGLGAWESGGNFYRPVNGGRVVKWVDSSGNIKTSVNMMPPEAHAIESTSASLGDSPATGTHNWSTVYQPQFGNKITGSDLITNGTFSSNTTGWTAEGNTTIASTAGGQSGNCLTITRGTSTTQTVKQTYASFVVGKWYKMSAYIKQGTDTGGTMHLRAEGAAATHYPNSPTFTSTGSFVKHSLVFKAETTSYEVMLRGTVDTDGQTILIDTVTLHEIEQPESQAEVAKTFHWREFGNGAANEGSSTSGTKQDASMYSAADAIAYVMDDGLTSLSGDLGLHNSGYGISVDSASKYFYITFIGTGISWKTGGAANNPNAIWAQNLPYGTHILKFITDSSNVWDGNVYLDGIDIKNDFASGSNRENYKWSALDDITFYQPKKPPIPEDAVVLADYMLMADFVPTTSDGTAGLASMSKGIRFCVASRDTFFDSGASISGEFVNPDKRAFTTFYNTNANSEARIVGFGHAFISEFDQWGNRQTDIQVRLDGSNYTYNSSNQFEGATGGIWDNTNDDGTISKGANNLAGVSMYGIKNQTLGVHTFGDKKTSGSDYNTWNAWGIATPIHTSSHYQEFENPYLKELVGGDRNMEQTNLVVTPDGKTWDEVTRDTSYIGNLMLSGNPEGVGTGNATDSEYYWIIDDWRGVSGGLSRFNKDFAIAYDRVICLKAGQYKIETKCYTSNTGQTQRIYLNGTEISKSQGEGNSTWTNLACETLQRGDYIQVRGMIYVSGAYAKYASFNITKL